MSYSPLFPLILGQPAHLNSPTSLPCLSQHPGGILICRTCFLWKLRELDWSLSEHTASTPVTSYFKPVWVPGSRARTPAVCYSSCGSGSQANIDRRLSIRRPPGYPTTNPDLQGRARWQTRALTLKNELKARLSHQPESTAIGPQGDFCHFFPSFLFKAGPSWNLEFKYKISSKVSKRNFIMWSSDEISSLPPSYSWQTPAEVFYHLQKYFNIMPLSSIPDMQTLNQCHSKLVFLSQVWQIFQAQDSSSVIWKDSSLSKTHTSLYLPRWSPPPS